MCKINAPVNVNPPLTPGKYGALAIKQNQTVIMPHIQGPSILSNRLQNMNKFLHPQAKLNTIFKEDDTKCSIKKLFLLWCV